MDPRIIGLAREALRARQAKLHEALREVDAELAALAMRPERQKPKRRKLRLSAEEIERRRARMKAYWAKRKKGARAAKAK